MSPENPARVQLKINRAEKRVKDLENQLSDFLAKERRVSLDLVERDPQYLALKKKLLRARGIVRSLKRQLKS